VGHCGPHYTLKKEVRYIPTKGREGGEKSKELGNGEGKDFPYWLDAGRFNKGRGPPNEQKKQKGEMGMNVPMKKKEWKTNEK